MLFVNVLPFVSRSYENSISTKTSSLPDLSQNYIPVQDESYSQNVSVKNVIDLYLYSLYFIEKYYKGVLVFVLTGLPQDYHLFITAPTSLHS